MDDVFVDTSCFKALVDGGDDFHQAAIELLVKMKEGGMRLVTTNYITDELFTLVRKRNGLERARELWDLLGELGGQLKMVRILVGDEKEAWKWFWREWKGLSFTDCTSFAVMERLGIKKVATFDEHFAKAGFKVMV